MVVPSGHFAESGPHGLALQQQLRERALQAGMRVVGPVSFGIINTNPVAACTGANLGLSVFASAGNRADLSSNDLMQYWIDAPATDAVGLYLETIGNPRKFSRIAPHLCTVKPVIVVKSAISY